MPRWLKLRPLPPENSPAVRVLTLGTVLVAVTAVGVHEEFTAQAILAAGAIAAGFVTSYLMRRRRTILIKAAITALIFIVARDFFAALIANPYDPRIPLVRLFLWLQALHSFDLPARKDLKYSLASAVVLMAVAAVYARDSAFGIMLLPFAAGASATMAAMVAAGRGPVALRPVLKAGAALALAAVVLGAVLFVAVPRGQGLRVRWFPVSPRLTLMKRLHGRILNPAYPNRALSEDPTQPAPAFNPEGYIGFSTYVDLRLRGTLADTVVMRVRTTRPAFWRGLAFDEYTGIGWRMTDKSVQEYASDQPRIVPRFGPDEPWPAGSEQVIQTFYIEATQPNVFFAAYRPFEVYVPTGSLGVDGYAGLRSPVGLEVGTIYSVISRVPAPGPLLLRRPRADIPESIRAKYLQLPAVPGRVRDLALAITASETSDYARAVAVNQHLIRNYTYNLRAPLLPRGADAVDYFLFASLQGSCEAFASAMVVLLRAAGVPARLVTGYTPGTYNVFTGYHDVRNSDAHAWVEVYLPGAGWIEFEPTPGFPTPEEATSRPAGQWLLWDAARWMMGVGRATIRGFRGEPLPTNSLAGMLTALVLSLVLVRRRNGIHSSRYDAISAVYALMLARLAREGIRREQSATPREFLARIPEPARTDAEGVTAAFERVRYGGEAADTVDAAALREAASRVAQEARRGGRSRRQ